MKSRALFLGNNFSPPVDISPELMKAFRKTIMHPAMALWLFSLVMARIWQATLMGEEYRPGDDFLPTKTAPLLVAVHAYLLTDLAKQPLPDILRDRLSDLYWTEREAALAI